MKDDETSRLHFWQISLLLMKNMYLLLKRNKKKLRKNRKTVKTIIRKIFVLQNCLEKIWENRMTWVICRGVKKIQNDTYQDHRELKITHTQIFVENLNMR